jgi:hypothetical protein
LVHSWVYVGAKGEGYEVVELRVQRWVGRGGLEKGWCGLGRCEVGEAVGWPEAVSLLEDEVIEGDGQRWPSSADWRADR